jgi:hypothetical protein
LDALERLSAPDPESRTPDFDGRRLVRVDGGYIILNFMKYRDRDTTAAERQQRYRERHKKVRNTVSRDGNGVTSRNITEAVSSKQEAVRSKQEAEKDEEAAAPADLSEHFTDQAHRNAYHAYRRAHRMPDGLDAALRSLASGMHGAAVPWDRIGAALLDMRAGSVDFSARAVAGFARKVGAPPHGGTNGNGKAPRPAMTPEDIEADRQARIRGEVF